MEMLAWSEYAYLNGVAKQVDDIRGFVASNEGLLWSSTHSTVARGNLSAFEATLADTLIEHTRHWLNLTDLLRSTALVIEGDLQRTGHYEEAAVVAADLGQVLPHADSYLTSLAQVGQLANGISWMDQTLQAERLSDIHGEFQRGLAEVETFADGFARAHRDLAERLGQAEAVTALPKWSSRRIRAAFRTVEEKAESTMQMLRKASQELVSAVDGATRDSDFMSPTTTTEQRELSWDDAAKILPLPSKPAGTD